MTNWFLRKNGLPLLQLCSLKIPLNTVLCSRKQTEVNQSTLISSLLYLPISSTMEALKILPPQLPMKRSNLDLASSFCMMLEATNWLILWSSKFLIKMITRYSQRLKSLRPSLHWLIRLLKPLRMQINCSKLLNKASSVLMVRTSSSKITRLSLLLSRRISRKNTRILKLSFTLKISKLNYSSLKLKAVLKCSWRKPTRMC